MSLVMGAVRDLEFKIQLCYVPRSYAYYNMQATQERGFRCGHARQHVPFATTRVPGG